MDSRNPYTQYSSYLGLLQSQTPSVVHENFPYESFQSQQSPSPAPTQPEVPPVQRKERIKWPPADDEVLISAWLNTSKDVVLATDQNARTFWKRVSEYYNANREASADKREQQHCKSRWHKINEFTNKFCAAYASTERQQASGQNDNDVLKVAHEIFYADHESRFNLEHAWCVLRYEQKWLNLNTPKITGSVKRKTGETASQATSSAVGDEESRPEGSKAAKARRTNSKGKATIDEVKEILEFKERESLMKEKLSKLAILDTLLAKKEPLTKAEEIVKNKLLALYF